jgi:hypothetical protein
MARRNDARLWALLCDEFRAAGVLQHPDPQIHARRAVAIVRRERATGTARTFAPGDSIPYDVVKVYDLDGDVWERQSAGPASTLRDSWKMPGFDRAKHGADCAGVWITPWLLDGYGPLTELPARSRA